MGIDDVSLPRARISNGFLLYNYTYMRFGVRALFIRSMPLLRVVKLRDVEVGYWQMRKTNRKNLGVFVAVQSDIIV